ncbi:MAG: tetratricopeptide repeat protein [Planctomycetia bacterium]|nr:tetratricopeptide repeat protein [Planctomycetia bacterium]
MCAVVVAGALVPDAAVGQLHRSGFDGSGVPGMSQMSVHQPWSSNYTPLTPNSFARRHNAGDFSGGFSSGSTTVVVGNGFYPFYPTYGPPWGYYAYPPPFYGPVFLPPLVIPSDLLYGPQAIKRFFGFEEPAPVAVPDAAQPAAIRNGQGGGFGILAPDPPDPPKAKRASGAEARARSQRFIVLGDGYFSKQEYSDANQRYRSAVQAAPDVAQGYFRQGFALLALGRYDLAVRSFKRGLKLDENWINGAFRLDLVYGDNQLAKAAHLEALANAAAKGPHSDLLFLVGTFLYFDGKADRAFPFFHRAHDLAGADVEHIDVFLKALAPPVAQPAPAAVAARPADARGGVPAPVPKEAIPAPPAKRPPRPAGVEL